MLAQLKNQVSNEQAELKICLQQNSHLKEIEGQLYAKEVRQAQVLESTANSLHAVEK